MKIQQLILEALNLPTNAIAYHVSQELAAFYPKKALLEASDSAFDLVLMDTSQASSKKHRE